MVELQNPTDSRGRLRLLAANDRPTLTLRFGRSHLRRHDIDHRRGGVRLRHQ